MFARSYILCKDRKCFLLPNGELRVESLAHLRQLLALADTANYRKAGERLGISHSVISQTISKLEHHYGVELFDRRRSETLPTVFGESRPNF